MIGIYSEKLFKSEFRWFLTGKSDVCTWMICTYEIVKSKKKLSFLQKSDIEGYKSKMNAMTTSKYDIYYLIIDEDAMATWNKSHIHMR